MKPFVTIVVTAYLEQSKPYLDLCIESIKNLDYPFEKLEVIIVSPPGYARQYDDDCLSITTCGPIISDYYNAFALNFGARHAAIHSEYFLFINDDVIMTKNSLKNMVRSSSHFLKDIALVMPIGNDQQQRYYLPVQIPSGPYRIDQVKAIAKDMMALESPHNEGFIFCESMCLYCVLIPRALFESVGGFDDSRQGQDDVDYCFRARQKGFINAIALNSLVWHAGGVSADITMSAESRKESLESFKRKWPDEV